jgi:hemerythrin-like domain-containing protein
MTALLEKLQDDHRNFALLLDVLERQLAIFERGERPDYDVLTAIANYFTGFPERSHHPREDLVFQRLRDRYPAAADAVGDLGGEHDTIGSLASDFHEAVQNVLHEVELPRAEFQATLRHFIDDQRRHMLMEKDRFFPVALEVLTKEDWAELETMANEERDALFDDGTSGDYDALRERIMQWQAEDEANAS